ncbi:MAG: (2Fe-2S)-binding protein [Alphaproteobacteria bacterium]|nr:(2Fe-2S)-binding protein [Alphaproteobacteria bacterium]
MARERVEVSLTINGRTYRDRVESRLLLCDFIRHVAGLKGTHVGCEHGVCGACTVLIDGRTARSCLHFAAAVEGSAITTVESLATEAALHPIQQAFHESHALQCGYCTPGFLLTTVELLGRNAAPTTEEIRQALTNNMCRCTGYANIVKAVGVAAAAMRGDGAAKA